jgi:hypothetical protein
MARKLEEALKRPFAGMGQAPAQQAAPMPPVPGPARQAMPVPPPPGAAPQQTAAQALGFNPLPVRQPEPVIPAAPPVSQPVQPAKSEAIAPVAPPPERTVPSAPPKPPEAIDFDSLEAEMSRLLGRDPGPPKQG